MLVLLAACLFATAHADDGEFAGYDSIIAELKADAETPETPRIEPLDWDSIALHGSLGLAGSYVTLPGATSGVLKGFELAVGANTFSRQVRAELAFRNFATDRLTANVAAGMREFEGRMIFLPTLTEDLKLRMGFGLTRRQLDVETTGPLNGTYYALLLGAERRVAGAVSVGPDLAYRDVVAHDGIRKSSWDASFRLNATF